MANQQQQPQAKTTKGTIDRVPCPFCGQPNDFRDLANGFQGQTFGGEEGNDIECDHCHQIMRIAAMNTITVVHVVQHKALRNKPQGQQPQRKAPGPGLINRLLGKG